MSPTAHSLALLRRSGYLAAVVESWIPQVNRRRDLFGFADILAVHRHREPGFLLVQATTLPNVPARLAKAREKPELAVWIRAGGCFEVWGWAHRACRWEVKRVSVSSGDLEPMIVQNIPRRRKEPRQRTLFDGDGAEVILAGPDAADEG